MKRQRTVQKNLAFYVGEEAAFNAAAHLITGSIIQLFLAYKGVGTAQIGLFNTVISLVSVLGYVAFSGLADQRPDILRDQSRLLRLAVVLYLPYLPMAMGMPGEAVFLCILIFGTLQTVLTACKGVLVYKLVYQIIPVEHYGVLSGTVGVGVGATGALISWVCSRLIDSMEGDRPYLMGMALCLALLVTAAVCGGRMRPVQQEPQSGMLEQKRVTLGQLMKRPEFTLFLIPNALRGITLGVTNSIVLIALDMGVSAAEAARLTVAATVGYVAGSGLFTAAEPKMGSKAVGLAGGVLLCGIVLMPVCRGTTLLLLYLAAYTGRVLVDHAVPTMVIGMIDPQISGAYNAWRMILCNVSAAATAYAVGVLVGKASPLALLIPCAAAYLVSMIWYCVLYEPLRARRQREENRADDPVR